MLILFFVVIPIAGLKVGWVEYLVAKHSPSQEQIRKFIASLDPLARKLFFRDNPIDIVTRYGHISKFKDMGHAKIALGLSSAMLPLIGFLVIGFLQMIWDSGDLRGQAFVIIMYIYYFWFIQWIFRTGDMRHLTDDFPIKKEVP